MAVNDHALPPDAPPTDGSCPDEEEIAALLDGTLPAGRRTAILDHLAGCESCSEIFAGALRFEVDEEPLMKRPFESTVEVDQQLAVTPQVPPSRPLEHAIKVAEADRTEVAAVGPGVEVDQQLAVTPQAPPERPLEHAIEVAEADRTEVAAVGPAVEVDQQLAVTPQAPAQRPLEHAKEVAEAGRTEVAAMGHMRRQPVPDRRRQGWSARSRAWRRGAAAAIAAVLVASLGVLLVRGTGDVSTEGMSADLLKSPAAMEKVPWRPPRVMRSGGPPEKQMPQNLADFRLGVGLLDLRLALASGKKEAADTTRRLGNVFRAMDFVPPESVKAFQRIRDQLERGIPPATLLPSAAAEEKKLASAGIEGQYVDLGRWTEACRLGAAARQEKVFHSRAARRLLDQAPALGEGISFGGDGPNQHAADLLREIKAAAGADPIDFDALGTRCKDLIDLLDSDD